jgi:chemotaxis protein MotB
MSGSPRRRAGGRRGASHDDAHGGQWKIAYADFVTAMMAFFLLMWLVSSATETQRAVIAKYFTTTSIFNLPKGNGVLDGGKAVMAGTEAKTERLTPSGMGGLQAQPVASKASEVAASAAAHTERQRFEALKAELEKMAREGELKGVADNLAIDLTPEGLRIQIFDRDGEPMFASGDAEPTPRLARILEVIGEVLQTVKNGVIIAGHTDAQVLKRGTYSNWELSTDRANSVRRRLEGGGLTAGRMVRVEGLAATDPLLPADPLDPRNRRIAITVLRSEVETQLRQQAAPSSGPSP